MAKENDIWQNLTDIQDKEKTIENAKKLTQLSHDFQSPKWKASEITLACFKTLGLTLVGLAATALVVAGVVLAIPTLGSSLLATGAGLEIFQMLAKANSPFKTPDRVNNLSSLSENISKFKNNLSPANSISPAENKTSNDNDNNEEEEEQKENRQLRI